MNAPRERRRPIQTPDKIADLYFQWPNNWIAIAALEAEPESTLLEQLKANANKWRKRWLSNNTFSTGPSRFFYAKALSNLLVLTGSALQEINSFAKVAIKRGAIGIVRGLV